MIDVLTRLTRPGLRRAVETLLLELSDHGTGDGAAADSLDWLRLLAIALEEEGVPDSAELSLAEVAGILRMLEQLRAALIDTWSGDEASADPAEMLRLLRSMERVRRSLQAEGARDSLAVLLSSQRGPEMLIELAHDLRSPLTSILFLADALLRGQSGGLNELQIRQLSILYRASLSLGSLAGNVIELAREGRGLRQARPSPFSVSQVLESVCDVVRPMVEEKGLELRVRLPCTDHRMGFPIPLSRVLLNLTTNALSATEQGFVEISAEEMPGGRVEFAVRDSGPGIEEEAIPHLYEPFRSGHSSDPVRFSGTGLGLTISKKLVAAMKGELRFDTRKNRGTRFFFQLPLPPVPPP